MIDQICYKHAHAAFAELFEDFMVRYGRPDHSFAFSGPEHMSLAKWKPDFCERMVSEKSDFFPLKSHRPALATARSTVS